jgi:Ca2+-binding RTX toxin-like protein
MTDFSPADYLEFSAAAYSDTPSPVAGLSPATFLKDANGDAFDFGGAYDSKTGVVYIGSTGLRAVIYSNGKTGEDQEIVIAFRGTVGGKDLFNSLTADAELATGITPDQFTQGEDLLQAIVQALPEAKTFVTGHSLGGAIGEFVSAQDEAFQGTTFGAPGISIPARATRSTVLIDTIDQADPVGTYTGPVPGIFDHVGTEDPIGSKSVERILFDDTLLSKLIGLATNIGHHLIKSYATLLNVPSLQDNANPHSLVDDPADPLIAVASFDNGLANATAEDGSNGPEIQSRKLTFALNTTEDVATIKGTTSGAEAVNATLVGGDGNSFSGGTSNDQVIALGDGASVLDGPKVSQETLVALGDDDTLIATSGASTLFALGNNDTLIASSDKGDDVVVGNGTVSTNLLQDRDPYSSLAEVLQGTGSGDDTFFSSVALYNQIAENGGTTAPVTITDDETILGGSGNDTIFATDDNPNGRLTIDGGGGENVVDFSHSSGPNSGLVASLVNFVPFTGSGGGSSVTIKNIQTIIGSPGNDTISLGSDSGKISAVDGAGGSDTFSAGDGDNIMIGDDSRATFIIDGNSHPNATDVIWGDGTASTYKLSGNVNVYLVNDPNADLKTVENLDVNSFASSVLAKAPAGAISANLGFTSSTFLAAPRSATTVIIIDPQQSDTISFDGHTVNGATRQIDPDAVNNDVHTALFDQTKTDPLDPSVTVTEVFNITDVTKYRFMGNDGLSYNAIDFDPGAKQNVISISQFFNEFGSTGDGLQISGFAAGDFGLAFDNNGTKGTDDESGLIIANDGQPHPELSLGPFQTHSVAPDIIDSRFFNTATPIFDLRQFQRAPQAGGGSGSGSGGGGGGVGGGGAGGAGGGAQQQQVTDQPAVTASNTSDNLVSIDAATVSGSNDALTANSGNDALTSTGQSNTLVGGSGTDTLATSGTGDTAIAGAGLTTLLSTGRDNTLIAGTAADSLFSTGTSDTLVGSAGGSTLDAAGGSGALALYLAANITANLATGTASQAGAATGDTLIGIAAFAALGANDTVIAGAGRNTLIAGGAGDTLLSAGRSNTLVATAAAETLLTSGSFDRLSAQGAQDFARSTGSDNTLIAGSPADTLVSSGTGDTFFSDGAGNTLDGSAGTGALAIYSARNLTVNLGSGTASVAGSGVADTLIGITTVETTGTNDTLIAGSGSETLLSIGEANTLIGGAGPDTLYSDGVDDTLLGGGGANVLISDFDVVGDTLVAGTGSNTLLSSGSGDLLVGNGGGSTLDGSLATAPTLLYAADRIAVDLTAGTAAINGSALHDTLFSLSNAVVAGNDDTLMAESGSNTMTASGSNSTLIGGSGTDTLLAAGTGDTLIGGSGVATLAGNGGGNTLIAGAGQAEAFFGGPDLILDLGANVARISGSSAQDTLIGITRSAVAGVGDIVLAGSGADTVWAFGSHDTLIAGNGSNLLQSGGTANTLIAGSGIATLWSSGNGDTMLGNGGGSTLEALGSAGAVAAYAADNVTVNLGAGVFDIGGFNFPLGSASVSGLASADTLIDVTIAAGFGHDDTLIGGSGSSTLLSDAGGNVLEAGSGLTVADYALDNVALNLAAGTAAVAGATVADTLVAITAAMVSGAGDTVIAGTGPEALAASGAHDTLIAGAGGDTLSATGQADTLIGGSGADTLSATGRADLLIGGSGRETLSSSGQGNTLVSGGGVDSLISSGTGDTLFGNALGSTLIGTPGIATVAAYALNNVTVNLGAGSISQTPFTFALGTASINGSASADTLFGITRALALGSGDTLIGGPSLDSLHGADTLSSDAAGNTLIAGSTQSVASYGLDNLIVDLVAGSARLNGAVSGDTLLGFKIAAVSGSNDTLVSDGSGNTLIATNASAVADYNAANIAIDLIAGTAKVAGSSAQDTLSGISNVAVFGTSDTVIAGRESGTLVAAGMNDTLSSAVGGSTLIGAAAASGTVAFYGGSLVSIDLAAGTASDAASGLSDTLIGIAAAAVSGSDDVLRGGSGPGTLASSGASNTLIAGSSAESLLSSGIGDTLVAGSATDLLRSTGSGNTLIAGSAPDTLISAGSGDTLIGNGGGNVLDGTVGIGAVAAFAADNLAIDLNAGTAKINGAASGDSLTGIAAVAVSGSSDTLLAGAAAATLSSSGSGNTLLAGTGVDLLSSSGTADTLLGGSGADVLTSSGDNNTLIAGAGATPLTSSGRNDTLIGGSAADILSASGKGDTLVAGTGSNTLSAAGSAETLFGNGGGSTLLGTAASAALAAYAVNSATINLAAGTASVTGSSSIDTLIGIAIAGAFGTNDTLLGGAGSTTLLSDAAGNTLVAGAGSTLAVYAANAAAVDLTAGTASVQGSSAVDRLVSISAVEIAGSGATLIAGDGGEQLLASGTSDTLIGGSGADLLSSSGRTNTLIAGSGTDTLLSSGAFDLLFGEANGSTLIGSATGGTEAAYAAANVAVDIATGSAGIAGSSTGDTLIGIDTVAALGSGETLIGGAAAGTLESDAGGNTLIAGTGPTTAVYAIDHVAVDLATGIAAEAGGTAADTLIGITVAALAGNSATLIGNGGADLFSASGSDDTVIAGSGADTLATNGAANTLLAGAGADLLVSSGNANALVGGAGADTLLSSGSGDTLLAGSGWDLVASDGRANTLIAGTTGDTLLSAGSGDTLFGLAGGDTLDGTAGAGAVAAYAIANVTVDLATATAAVNGGSGADTLLGITIVAAFGGGDTLIGGSAGSGSTLISNAAGNTLIAGAGPTTAIYATDAVTVDLATGQAAVNGSSLHDTLVGISSIVVAGSADTALAGSGGETIAASGSGDTLLAGAGSELLLSSGFSNLLIAGSGSSTLLSAGSGDTLIGAGSGNTLIASGGSGAVAGYTAANLTVDLATGSAAVNGAAAADTLIGIGIAAALGTGETLIGGSAATTLVGNGGGNTLIAGSGPTIAAYAADHVTVDLATGTASVNGATTTDSLIGFTAALVSGTADTLVAGTGAELLQSTGSANALIAGSGSDTLSSSGSSDTLIGGSGLDVVISIGTGDTLIARSGSDTLVSSGSSNTLIAGSAIDTLSSSGIGDMLVGTANGSTLDGTNGIGTIAAYALNDVTVNLATATAAVKGSSVSDTLTGIAIAAAFGAGDTLIGGTGSTTLVSDAAGNTLIAGSGPTEADYGLGDVTVNLATETAAVNGSTTGDTLLGITDAAVLGTGDTLIAGNGPDIFLSRGASNTLIAGSGQDTLTSIGSGDTLVGNANGSTLDGTGGFGAIAAYTSNNATVDLATATASISGSSPGDTLLGIEDATVAGSDDTLIGDALGDTLAAGGSEDTVIGGAGDDVLLMSSGTNTFFGGGGNNSFVVLSAAVTASVDQPQNLIADFDPSNSDEKIDLSHLSSVTSFADLTFATLTFGTQSFLQVTLGSTGQAITLAGVTANQLSAANFVFAPSSNVQSTAGTGVVLQGGAGTDTLITTGTNDTLLAGSGNETLIVGSGGSGNTLIGGSGTSTLIGNGDANTLEAGSGQTAAVYAIDNVTVDLRGGAASVNGSSVSDTLIGISDGVVSGHDDTLLGGTGNDTLVAAGVDDVLNSQIGIWDGSNTLIGTGAAGAMALYTSENAVVDLATGTATAPGGNDTLVGINIVSVTAYGDTAIGGSGNDTLLASADNETLVAGSGNTLIGSGSGEELLGDGAGNTLAGSGGGVVAAYVAPDITIDMATQSASVNGSSASDKLLVTTVAASAGDTLIGNADGHTLEGIGAAPLLSYTLDDVAVNLKGVAFVNGSSVSDTLIGISDGVVSGHNDTLFGGTGNDTLRAAGIDDVLNSQIGIWDGSNTLIGTGAGATALYTADHAVVDLATGTATAAGGNDTLAGINIVSVTGFGDTAIGGSGNDTLLASGADDVLVAGGGTETLVGSGSSEGYQFAPGAGQATVVNGEASATAPSNELDFGTGVSDENLWFQQSGNDLQIDVMGTQNSITVAGWFASAGNQLQEITAGGLKLDSQVSQLVQAMATFAANNPGFNPTAVAQAPNDPTLQNAITTSWHH